MSSARIPVRFTTRASRDAIAGFQAGAGDGRARGDVLVVRVTAPPVEGRANDALLRLLARALDLPPSALRLVAGEASRLKVVEVVGLESAEVRRRLEEASTHG